FGGVGSTAVAAIREGRKAICIDQNPNFVKEMRARVKKEQLDLNAFDARQGDSRDLSGIEDGSIDLIVTSPPYWDKA
ncbi:methyltransferase domain-containing protein, partial [Escherichia coli]